MYIVRDFKCAFVQMKVKREQKKKAEKITDTYLHEACHVENNNESLVW